MKKKIWIPIVAVTVLLAVLFVPIPKGSLDDGGTRDYIASTFLPLLRLGAPRTGRAMKQIQEWLGHSDMSTTANIYSHLDAVTKADTGAAMSKALG